MAPSPSDERWGWRVVGPDRLDKTMYTALEEGAALSQQSAQKLAAKRLLVNPFATTCYVWQMGPQGGWKSSTPMLVGFEDTLGTVRWT